MKSPVLCFFLLVLQVLFNSTPDIVYKRNKFSKFLLKKDFKFVLDEKNGPITLDQGLIILLVEVDLFPKEQSYIREIFIIFGSSNFEIVLTLLIKVVIFYM